MHRLVRVRLVSAVALVVAGSIAVGPLVSPASASAPTTCTSFTVTIKGVGALSKCNDPKNTGGAAKFVANTKKSPYSATITWNKTGTTTTSLTYSGLAKGAKTLCKGSTDIIVTGSVTGGTGAAIKSIPKGAKVSAHMCYKTSLSLAPKTVFSI